MSTLDEATSSGLLSELRKLNDNITGFRGDFRGQSKKVDDTSKKDKTWNEKENEKSLKQHEKVLNELLGGSSKTEDADVLSELLGEFKNSEKNNKLNRTYDDKQNKALLEKFNQLMKQNESLAEKKSKESFYGKSKSTFLDAQRSDNQKGMIGDTLGIGGHLMQAGSSFKKDWGDILGISASSKAKKADKLKSKYDDKQDIIEAKKHKLAKLEEAGVEDSSTLKLRSQIGKLTTDSEKLLKPMGKLYGDSMATKSKGSRSDKKDIAEYQRSKFMDSFSKGSGNSLQSSIKQNQQQEFADTVWNEKVKLTSTPTTVGEYIAATFNNTKPKQQNKPTMVDSKLTSGEGGSSFGMGGLLALLSGGLLGLASGFGKGLYNQFKPSDATFAKAKNIRNNITSKVSNTASKISKGVSSGMNAIGSKLPTQMESSLLKFRMDAPKTLSNAFAAISNMTKSMTNSPVLKTIANSKTFQTSKSVGSKIGNVASKVAVPLTAGLDIYDRKANKKQTNLQTGIGVAGGLGGMYAGAASGAAIGAIGGPVGAFIGGIIGGALGYKAGGKVGDFASGAMGDRSKVIKDGVNNNITKPLESLFKSSEVKQFSTALKSFSKATNDTLKPKSLYNESNKDVKKLSTSTTVPSQQAVASLKKAEFQMLADTLVTTTAKYENSPAYKRKENSKLENAALANASALGVK